MDEWEKQAQEARERLKQNIEATSKKLFGESLREEHKVDRLLRAGADPNVTDEFGRTPLSYASSYDVKRRLFEAGADPFIADKDGITPIEHNFDWNDKREWNLPRTFSTRYFDPSAMDEETLRQEVSKREAILKTPNFPKNYKLFASGSAEEVRNLIVKGVDPNADYGTPLRLACAYRNVEAVKVLTELGASAENDRVTEVVEDIEVAKILFRAGATSSTVYKTNMLRLADAEFAKEILATLPKAAYYQHRRTDQTALFGADAEKTKILFDCIKGQEKKSIFGTCDFVRLAQKGDIDGKTALHSSDAGSTQIILEAFLQDSLEAGMRTRTDRHPFKDIMFRDRIRTVAQVFQSELIEIDSIYEKHRLEGVDVAAIYEPAEPEKKQVMQGYGINPSKPLENPEQFRTRIATEGLSEFETRIAKTLIEMENASVEKEGDINKRLRTAIRNGDVEHVRFIIESGNKNLDLNATYQRSSFGHEIISTPLSDVFAAQGEREFRDDRQTRILELLKNAGATVNNQYPIEELNSLFQGGYYDYDRDKFKSTVKLWVAGGADINIPDENGDTILHAAGSLKHARALIELGADPTIKNAEGKTVIEVIPQWRSRNSQEIIEFLEGAIAAKDGKSQSAGGKPAGLQTGSAELAASKVLNRSAGKS